MFILPVVAYLFVRCYARSLPEWKRDNSDATLQSSRHLKDAFVEAPTLNAAQRSADSKRRNIDSSKIMNDESSKECEKCCSSNKDCKGCRRSECWCNCGTCGGGDAGGNTNNDGYGSNNNECGGCCDFWRQLWRKNCFSNRGACSYDNSNSNNDDACANDNSNNNNACAFTNNNNDANTYENSNNNYMNDNNNNNDCCGCARDCCDTKERGNDAGDENDHGNDGSCCTCEKNNYGACAFANNNNDAGTCENNNNNGACAFLNNNNDAHACENNINYGACASASNNNNNNNNNNAFCGCTRDCCDNNVRNNGAGDENDHGNDASCCMKCPFGVCVDLCRCYKHFKDDKPITVNRTYNTDYHHHCIGSPQYDPTKDSNGKDNSSSDNCKSTQDGSTRCDEPKKSSSDNCNNIQDGITRCDTSNKSSSDSCKNIQDGITRCGEPQNSGSLSNCTNSEDNSNTKCDEPEVVNMSLSDVNMKPKKIIE